MKKYIMTIIFAIGFGMSLNAQSDGFFNSSYSEYRDQDDWGQNMPMLPTQHGTKYDFAAEEAPVGSGLLLLAGMGLAYGMRKKSK